MTKIKKIKTNYDINKIHLLRGFLNERKILEKHISGD